MNHILDKGSDVKTRTVNGEIKREIGSNMRNAKSYNAPPSCKDRIQTTNHSKHMKCFQRYQTRNRLTNLQSFKAFSVTTKETMRVAIVCCYRPWWLNITYTGRPSFFCDVTCCRLAVAYRRFGQPFEPRGLLLLDPWMPNTQIVPEYWRSTTSLRRGGCLKPHRVQWNSQFHLIIFLCFLQ